MSHPSNDQAYEGLDYGINIAIAMIMNVFEFVDYNEMASWIPEKERILLDKFSRAIEEYDGTRNQGNEDNPDKLQGQRTQD